MASQPENESSTRRDFLRNAAVATAAVVATPGVAKSATFSLAPSRAIGANDRVGIAIVGLGNQGYGAHTRLLKQHAQANNTAQVAVCDLYRRRLRRAGTELGISESGWYADYKKMLENKDVDAVVVATADNWHAPIAIDSMKAGKHVYCEKPMCKGVGEAYEIYDTVKATKCVFQVGSQGTSDPMYYKLQEIVKSGKIGKMVMGQHSYNRGDNRVGEWNNYGDNPFKAPSKPGDADHRKAGPQASGDDHIDWETFRRGHGPAAWDPDRFFRWRKYWAYGNGLVGDLMPHRLHPMYIAMNIPMTGNQGFPKRVSSGGVLAVQKVNPDTGKPDREVPDFTYTTADFDDFSMIIMSSTVSEMGMRPMIRGNKATILFASDSAQITPARAFSEEVEQETIPLQGNGEPIPVHQRNWLDSIRTGKTPNGNIELALRVQVLIGLGEFAFRNNETFTFDPATRSSAPDWKKFSPY